jgi:hypothetical protein
MNLTISKDLEPRFRRFIESEINELMEKIKEKLKIGKQSKVIEIKLQRLEEYCNLLAYFEPYSQLPIQAIRLRQKYKESIR